MSTIYKKTEEIPVYMCYYMYSGILINKEAERFRIIGEVKNCVRINIYDEYW